MRILSSKEVNCRLWKFSLNCYDLNWTSYIILNIYLKRRFPGFFLMLSTERMSIFFSFGQNSKSWIYLMQKDSGMNLKISFIHLIFLLVFFQASRFLQKTFWVHLFGFISKLPIGSFQICTFQMISSISHRNFLFSLSSASGKCSLLNKI